MINSNFHTTVSIVLLGAVIFFSTGFTAVVKYCSMSQSSECCCESDQSDNAATQTNEPSVADQSSSCLSVRIIGGLNDIKAIATSESSAKVLAVETILLNSELILLPTLTNSPSIVFTDDIAPPYGDIYIRISSLLI